MTFLTLFLERIRNEKKLQYILLAGIVALGIFLRTVHFQSWMEFSPDQARDATVIDKVLSGKESLPLLGAESGNTGFKLGPIAYHWQYLSGLVFGPEPYNLAYPDLIFSILALPLFFFLMRKYFAADRALLLTFLMSTSFFLVKYARFAWNPNAAPFFSLLFVFSLLEMLDPKRKGTLLWSALLGISIGVSVQLHTLFIFILPVVAGVGFLLWIKRGLFSWKALMMVLACFLLVNWAQIYSDINRNAANSKLFFKAIGGTSSEGSTLGRDIGLATACEVQANIFNISSWGNIGKCMTWERALLKKGSEMRWVFVFGTIFMAGGYMLLVSFLRREDDERRKDFLTVFALYAAVSFLVSIPVITQVSARYYITSFFIPFVLCGFWLVFLLKKRSTAWMILSTILAVGMVLVLVGGNIRTLASWNKKLQHKSASDSKTVFYGELLDMTQYIRESTPDKEIGIVGERTYVSRFFKPLEYIAKEQGVHLINIPRSKISQETLTSFSLHKAVQKSKLSSGVYKDQPIESYRSFGQVMILKVQKEGNMHQNPASR